MVEHLNLHAEDYLVLFDQRREFAHWLQHLRVPSIFISNTQINNGRRSHPIVFGQPL